MTTHESGDPFAAADSVPLNVPGGVFDERAGDPPERTGATNARILMGGRAAQLRATPVAKRAGWLVAVAAIALILVIIPAGITAFASVRRAAIEEAAADAAAPQVVQLSAETVAVMDELSTIDTAYLASNAIAADPTKSEMAGLIAETNEKIFADDAAGARDSFESSLSFFVSDYSQSLPARADEILEEYPESNWETDERLDELKSTILANAGGQDLNALVSAVVELPQRVADAMSEHLGNRVTYVPPTPTSTAPPATTPPAPTNQPTQPPTTQQPQPTYTQVPGPTGGGGNNGGGGNGGGGGGNNGGGGGGGDNDD